MDHNGNEKSLDSAPSFEDDRASFELRCIRKTYKTGSSPALDGITVRIPRDARVAILGQSAAGKSTLMHILGLLDNADPASVNGKPLPKLTYFDGTRAYDYFRYDANDGNGAIVVRGRERDRLRKRDFGFVFQHGYLLEHQKCVDNVALGLALAGMKRSERRKIARDWMEKLGLESCAYKKARELAGGEKQRVAVLRAIVSAPRVLFADEPTGHLDRDNARLVMQQLESWQEHGSEDDPRTLLLVTHDIQIAFKHCEYYLLIRDGRLLGNGVFAKRGVAGEFCPTAGHISSPDELFERMVGEWPADQDSDLPHNEQPAQKRPASVTRRTESNRGPDRRPLPASPRATFLLSLAIKDAFRREHLIITATSLVILVLMSLLCNVGLGLIEGKRRVMSRELDDPNARRLDARFADHETVIADNIISCVRNIRLPNGQPAFSEPDKQVRRWNGVQHLFWTSENERKDDFVRGRTATPGDMVFSSLEYLPERACEGFDNNFSRQIVVTHGFLDELGLSSDATDVVLDYQKQRQRLKIVGVAHSIPSSVSEQEFILPDGFQQSISQKKVAQEATAACVELRPISPDQIDDVRRVLQGHIPQDLDADPEYKDGALVLTVAGDGEKYLWRLDQQAGNLIQRIELECESVKTGTLEICHPPPPDHSPLANKERANSSRFGFVSLYVASIDDLEHVAVEAKRCGLRLVAPEILGVVRRLRNTIGPLQKMLFFVVVIAGVIAVMATGVNMWQRVRQKRFETGVLKACGMTTWQLLAIYSFEGLILGLVAAGVSIPLSLLLGKGIALNIADAERPGFFWASPEWWTERLPSHLFAEPDSKADLLFQYDAAIMLSVIACLIGICVIACWFATLFSAIQQPAKAVTE